MTTTLSTLWLGSMTLGRWCIYDGICQYMLLHEQPTACEGECSTTVLCLPVSSCSLPRVSCSALAPCQDTLESKYRIKLPRKFRDPAESKVATFSILVQDFEMYLCDRSIRFLFEPERYKKMFKRSVHTFSCRSFEVPDYRFVTSKCHKADLNHHLNVFYCVILSPGFTISTINANNVGSR